MSNPQLEDGYLRIANELYEEIIKHPFTKTELLIVLAVIRKTYGYQKKSDQISLTQIGRLTGLNPANVSRGINQLVDKQVLLKQQGRIAYVIELNKKHKEWKVLLKQQQQPTIVKSTTDYCQINNNTIVKSTTPLLLNQQPQKTTTKNKKDNNKRKRVFVKPTHEEVTEYCKERNNGIDPESFISFYESKGWKIGKEKMVDWKACVRTWEKRNHGNSSTSSSKGNKSNATGFWEDVGKSIN